MIGREIVALLIILLIIIYSEFLVRRELFRLRNPDSRPPTPDWLPDLPPEYSDPPHHHSPVDASNPPPDIPDFPDFPLMI